MVVSNLDKSTLYNTLLSTESVCKYPMSIDTTNVKGDISRLEKLADTPMGEGHDNALCGIIVQFDLKFTIKAWTEAERYHFFDIVSSQSTMHRLNQMNLDESFIKYTDKEIIERLKYLRDRYNEDNTIENFLTLIYSCPVGLQLTAGMTTNYRQLKTIYRQRKNHRLPEWRQFCAWIETLPLSYLITGEKDV